MNISKNIIIASIVICLCLGLVFLIYLSFLSRSVVSLDDKNILIITPRSNDSFVSKSGQSHVTPTPNLPGVYSKDMIVKVNGTGGDGLRIREFAGLEETPIFLGTEGEEFKIIAGPEIYESAIWWKIQSIENPIKAGWAVQDYLSQY